jgi:tetratricopeptide (TPR) repeat protein
MRTGQLHEAETLLRRASRFDPNEMGMIAMRAGNYPEMLRWFDIALRIEPKHAPTHRAMAEFLIKAGQLGEAQKHWETAKEVDPTGTVSRPPIPVPRN